MKSRKWILSSRLVVRVGATLLACVVFVLAAQSVMAALTCVNDSGGANDNPGQRDLTRWCVDYDYSATQHQLIWDWDDIAWSGSNTGDACSLYDNDGDGKVNYALCVTVWHTPAVEKETRLYSCGNAKSDRCTTSTEILSFTSYCDVSQQGTDPFATGAAYPQDSVADCKVLETEVGTGTWIDVCSYPSEVPNSAPADCVAIMPATAYLTLEKTVTNDSGGTATEADFQAYIDTTAVPWDTAWPLDAGTYTASEVALVSGYTASAWGGNCASGGSVTLAAGENKTCTITNNDVAPTLTLVKTVVNDNSGTLQVGDFPLFIDATAATSGVAYPVQANVQHTASETQQPGYLASAWGGHCSAIGTITLLPGENKTCTITNNDQQAYITVVKSVTNDDGGSAAPDDFDLTLEGNPVLSGVAVAVDPGTYTAGETLLSGYTFQGFSGACDSSGDVTVALGESKTCYITNNDVAPTLTLVKTVVNDNSGTLQVGDFPLFIDATAATSGVAYPVQANVQHTASETQQPGYLASAWGGHCSAIGTITLLPGENKTCTITNNDLPPQVAPTPTSTPPPAQPQPTPTPPAEQFVPELGSLALLGSGMAGLAGYGYARLRRRKK